MNNPIDIALVEAYTNEVLNVCKTANNIIAQAKPSWHPTTDVPDEERLAVIRTKNGEIFFSRPINGRWMDFVKEWCPLPD